MALSVSVGLGFGASVVGSSVLVSVGSGALVVGSSVFVSEGFGASVVGSSVLVSDGSGDSVSLGVSSGVLIGPVAESHLSSSLLSPLPGSSTSDALETTSKVTFEDFFSDLRSVR